MKINSDFGPDLHMWKLIVNQIAERVDAWKLIWILNRTDTSYCQIKMGMVAYLGADRHMFNKTDTTCQQVNLGMMAYLGAVQTL